MPFERLDAKEFTINCCCHEYNHQFRLWYLDEDEEDLFVEVMLIPYSTWYKRIWQGIRIMFGHRATGYDTFLLDTLSAKDMIRFLNVYLVAKEHHNA